MIDGRRGIVLKRVGALFSAGTFAGMSDGQLLEHFLARGGEAGELAFAALVERHGPMVLRTCRGVLGDRHEAEDAFQATFLALVRGAGSIRCRESVGGWLRGAALRVSASARSAGARRRRHEDRAAATGRAGPAPTPGGEADLAAVVHEELARLPEPYREAVALCDLDGLTLAEAATRLGCPVGTVKSRVARGRQRLGARLTRRGVAPTAGLAVASATIRGAKAAPPPALLDATTRAAAQLAAGRGVVGLLAASVETLVRNETRRMLMRRIGVMTVALATAGVLAAGAGLRARQSPGPRAEANGEAFPADGLFYAVYNVPGLVKQSQVDAGGVVAVEMEPLMELLAATVAPGSWKGRDTHGKPSGRAEGPGTMEPSGRDGRVDLKRETISLKVLQTAKVHDQIRERLDQLGRLVTALPPAAGEPTLYTAGRLMYLPELPRPGLPALTITAPGGANAVLAPAAPLAAPRPPEPPATAVGPPHFAPAAAPGGPAPPAVPRPPAAPPGPIHVAPLPAGALPAAPIGGAPPADEPASASPGLPPGRPGLPAAGTSMMPPPGRRPSDAETERRLRAVEEKLDRVLKALEVPPPAANPGAGARP